MRGWVQDGQDLLRAFHAREGDPSECAVDEAKMETSVRVIGHEHEDEAVFIWYG
jgi:hypothetical protein